MNVTYRDLMISHIHAAVSAAKAVSGVQHSGLKGQLREIIIRELLRPLFPSDIGVGTGEIITANNDHSSQQDIVIYHKGVLPPLLADNSTGLFPIESVLFTVEVKSKLTADELGKAHQNAQRVAGFEYQTGQYDDYGNPINYPTKPCVSTLFAFDTDLSEDGKIETVRYDEIRGSKPPSIRVLCVVGRGYWLWRNNQWHEFNRTYQFEEVVGFLAGMLNTYRRILAARGSPMLGRYLAPFGEQIS
jgi:hypothetical protein